MRTMIPLLPLAILAACADGTGKDGELDTGSDEPEGYEYNTGYVDGYDEGREDAWPASCAYRVETPAGDSIALFNLPEVEFVKEEDIVVTAGTEQVRIGTIALSAVYAECSWLMFEDLRLQISGEGDLANEIDMVWAEGFSYSVEWEMTPDGTGATGETWRSFDAGEGESTYLDLYVDTYDSEAGDSLSITLISTHVEDEEENAGVMALDDVSRTVTFY